MILKCQLSLKKNNRTLSYSLYIYPSGRRFSEKKLSPCRPPQGSTWTNLLFNRGFVTSLKKPTSANCLLHIDVFACSRWEFSAVFRFVMHHRIVDALLMRFGSLLCASDSLEEPKKKWDHHPQGFGANILFKSEWILPWVNVKSEFNTHTHTHQI